MCGSLVNGRFSIALQVYQANVEKKFESLCGEVGARTTSFSCLFDTYEKTFNLADDFFKACIQVSRLRLLGNSVHSTRIAFVEFVMVSNPWVFWFYVCSALGKKYVWLLPASNFKVNLLKFIGIWIISSSMHGFLSKFHLFDNI